MEIAAVAVIMPTTAPMIAAVTAWAAVQVTAAAIRSLETMAVTHSPETMTVDVMHRPEMMTADAIT